MLTLLPITIVLDKNTPWIRRIGVALKKVEAFAAICSTLWHLENGRTKAAAGILVASGSLCVGDGALSSFSTMKKVSQSDITASTRDDYQRLPRDRPSA
jgi:hypothetical protein